MKVFVIGGTGYVGRGVVRALLAAGHQVSALARSSDSAAKLPPGDVTVLSGSIADLAVLRQGVAEADAVVYAAIAGMQGVTPEDRAAIAMILDELAGSDRSFVMTSGLGVYMGAQDFLVDEDTSLAGAPASQAWRVELEAEFLAAGREHGIRTVVLRPPIVYGESRLPPLIRLAILDARAKGRAFYVGEGVNLIPCVHVDDLGRAYVHALERAPAGSLFNLVAENVTGRDLARAVGLAAGAAAPAVSATLEEAQAVFGPAAGALVGNRLVSRVKAIEGLGWSPEEPSVLNDLAFGSMKALAEAL